MKYFSYLISLKKIQFGGNSLTAGHSSWIESKAILYFYSFVHKHFSFLYSFKQILFSRHLLRIYPMHFLFGYQKGKIVEAKTTKDKRSMKGYPSHLLWAQCCAESAWLGRKKRTSPLLSVLCVTLWMWPYPPCLRVSICTVGTIMLYFIGLQVEYNEVEFLNYST